MCPDATVSMNEGLQIDILKAPTMQLPFAAASKLIPCAYLCPHCRQEAAHPSIELTVWLVLAMARRQCQ